MLQSREIDCRPLGEYLETILFFSWLGLPLLLSPVLFVFSSLFCLLFLTSVCLLPLFRETSFFRLPLSVSSLHHLDWKGWLSDMHYSLPASPLCMSYNTDSPWQNETFWSLRTFWLLPTLRICLLAIRLISSCALNIHAAFSSSSTFLHLLFRTKEGRAGSRLYPAFL